MKSSFQTLSSTVLCLQPCSVCPLAIPRHRFITNLQTTRFPPSLAKKPWTEGKAIAKLRPTKIA